MGIPHAPKPHSEIAEAGGAYVRRRFTFGTREMTTGDRLTAGELATIPLANLRALINTGKIELWPAAPSQMFIADRFAVNRGFGKWDVIEGRKLNDTPLTREQAEALAATSTN
jgi:hypothetical protein